MIDSYDLGLMDLLSLDGRASTKFLAEQVGLTDATVAARLRELMDRDVVRVRAVVDWDQAGLKAPMVFFIRVHGRSVRGLADELLPTPRCSRSPTCSARPTSSSASCWPTRPRP